MSTGWKEKPVTYYVAVLSLGLCQGHFPQMERGAVLESRQQQNKYRKNKTSKVGEMISREHGATSWRRCLIRLLDLYIRNVGID